MYSCSFIGHKNCPKGIKDCLSYTIEELIRDKNINKFFVGTQGNFDAMVYQVLCELEKKYKIQIFIVLAYLNRTANNDYYDVNKTIFPDELTKTPLRFAIKRRNTFMIDKSDYIICYLNTPFSNAFSNIEYAVKKKKNIINLGSFDIKSI